MSEQPEPGDTIVVNFNGFRKRGTVIHRERSIAGEYIFTIQYNNCVCKDTLHLDWTFAYDCPKRPHKVVRKFEKEISQLGTPALYDTPRKRSQPSFFVAGPARTNYDTKNQSDSDEDDTPLSLWHPHKRIKATDVQHKQEADTVESLTAEKSTDETFQDPNLRAIFETARKIVMTL